MRLRLNLPSEYIIRGEETIPIHREFYGRNIEQMPRLIADKRIPIGVSYLMSRKLTIADSSGVPRNVKDEWMDSYVNTGDAIVYHPNGEALIVLDSKELKEITDKSPRNGGAVILGENKDEAMTKYNAIKKRENVFVFKKGEFGKTGVWMSKAEVKAHGFWKVLARDKNLLDDYVDLVFAECKERENYDLCMGVYPGLCLGDKPEMRALCVSGLDGLSDIYNVFTLNDICGRLIGKL